MIFLSFSPQFWFSYSLLSREKEKKNPTKPSKFGNFFISHSSKLINNNLCSALKTDDQLTTAYKVTKHSVIIYWGPGTVTTYFLSTCYRIPYTFWIMNFHSKIISFNINEFHIGIKWRKSFSIAYHTMKSLLLLFSYWNEWLQLIQFYRYDRANEIVALFCSFFVHILFIPFQLQQKIIIIISTCGGLICTMYIESINQPKITLTHQMYTLDFCFFLLYLVKIQFIEFNQFSELYERNRVENGCGRNSSSFFPTEKFLSKNQTRRSLITLKEDNTQNNQPNFSQNKHQMKYKNNIYNFAEHDNSHSFPNPKSDSKWYGVCKEIHIVMSSFCCFCVCACSSEIFTIKTESRIHFLSLTQIINNMQQNMNRLDTYEPRVQQRTA